MGDQVLLVAGGISVFQVVEVEGDHALVAPIQADAPGGYSFPARVAALVPVDTGSGE
ncbi:hypothetical protein DFR70_13021 [Nocardia tenerifensis]|uniref:Uncharacterized protein n=2 Tax=Nocardia tenerifensis TaxID=228006 RepID=A0A318JN90_9NOCA|nr:hypothetical protein DFR70_13021 [Nocardia tenerifensis]